MKAFYGSASYLWLILAITCIMDQHGDYSLLWISLFVGAYAIIGKSVIFMVKLMWDMEHDPARRQEMMDAYMSYIMDKQELRRYIKYGK